MDYTYATVIVADADRAQAQADTTTEYFNTPLSASGAAPATHWITSGPFGNDELNRIANDVAWPRQIMFGREWKQHAAAAGLQQVEEVAS